MDLLKISIGQDGYTQPIVTMENENNYEVIDGFPRLTNDSLKKKLLGSVSAVEYLINLDGADSFCIASSPDKNIKFYK